MEQVPDSNVLIDYLMLMIYCLLMTVCWLGSVDDAQADEKTRKPEQVKIHDESFAAQLLRVGFGLYAGLGVASHLPAGKPASGLDEVDRETFLLGARAAFDTIVTAYAAGHLDPLDGLVADWVIQRFDAALAERRKRDEQAKLEIVAITAVEIERVETDAEQIEVTVRFVTDQITALFDARGMLLAGSPWEMVEVTDLWRFARQRDALDPNWVLVATE